MATLCEEIGAWAASLAAADLPASVAERARLQADSIAAGRAAGAGLTSGAGAGGIAGLDVGALRMTFPSRMRIKLRGGSVRAIEGDEPGSCGRSLQEQCAVVEEKLAIATADRGGRGGRSATAPI